MASNYRPLKNFTTGHGYTGRQQQVFGRFSLLPTPNSASTATAATAATNTMAPKSHPPKRPTRPYDYAGRREQILANIRTLARFATAPRSPENRIKFSNYEIIVAHSIKEGFTASVIGYDDDDTAFKTLYEDSDEDDARAMEKLFLNVSGDVGRFLGRGGRDDG